MKKIITSFIIGAILGGSALIISTCFGNGYHWYCQSSIFYLSIPALYLLFIPGLQLIVFPIALLIGRFGSLGVISSQIGFSIIIPLYILIGTIEVYIIFSLVSFIAKLIKVKGDKIQE